MDFILLICNEFVIFLSFTFRATVLYDRPAAQFQSITLEQKHDLFYRLAIDYYQFKPDNFKNNPEEFQATRFTYKDSNGTIHLRNDRPAILVSSTSWTPDEDFSILLKALDREYTYGSK